VVYLIITYKVEHVLYRYFPEKWTLWIGGHYICRVALFSSEHTIFPSTSSPKQGLIKWTEGKLTCTLHAPNINSTLHEIHTQHKRTQRFAAFLLMCTLSNIWGKIIYNSKLQHTFQIFKYITMSGILTPVFKSTLNQLGTYTILNLFFTSSSKSVWPRSSNLQA
jgi:hypothetical protein